MTAFVDLPTVRRQFARAAATYGSADFLAREIDRRMAERLDYVKISPALVLDVGCGQGASLPHLTQRYPEAMVLGLDATPEMLQRVPGREAPSALQKLLPFLKTKGPRLAAASATQLPLASGKAGLLWSNQMLFWLDDPLPAIQEAHRVLEVGGLYMFSSLGPDTLKEVRAAFADGHPHTQRFYDMHDLGGMLAASGFSDPVVDMEVITLTYHNLETLLAELRQSGSQCAMKDRPKGLRGKTAGESFRQRYEALRRDGRLPATFEVIYGHAWKAPAKKAEDGRSIVRFMPRPE